MITADVICDSVSPEGHRLTTFKLRYPRFLHAEFLTHRALSRNASSSRAVPTAKLIEEIELGDLARPTFWGKDQRGMQAREEINDSAKFVAHGVWSLAAAGATSAARRLMEQGVHKQTINRVLEPFTHINVVATATEWSNFFALRRHDDAQPEMRALAEAMWAAYQGSEPKLLLPGEWHLPFSDRDLIFKTVENGVNFRDMTLDERIKVSVARCARVSYESFETGRRSTVEEDLKLYEKLVGAQPLHASPAEHQATPDSWRRNPILAPPPQPDGNMIRLGKSDIVDNDDYERAMDKKKPGTSWNCINLWDHPRQHKNFVGWRQYRAMLPGEDAS